ncbi:four helix bundle protein [Calidithermus chliarophilus]|uniref:four helix bundle protein n=1 Tax=Calidithermus chliarophilus TaxID=52023 RepID=UPI00040A42D8|nr:four helix bundle protein [Calidithermus chliarophilus]
MGNFNNRFGFENLEVYQLALDMTAEIYKVTAAFPKAEQYRLTDQVCRAATSIALNIAEGRGRGTDKDFCRFLHNARGSLLETLAGLQVAVRLGLLDASAYDTLTDQAGRLNAKINALISTLKQD